MRLCRAVLLPLLLTLAVLPVAGCGEDADPEPISTSVDALVDVTPKFLREPVRVQGTAVPVSDDWFILRGHEDAILVAPEPGTVQDGPARGQDVTVVGVVENFNRLQLEELGRLRRSGRHPALGDAQIRRGGAYVSADRVE